MKRSRVLRRAAIVLLWLVVAALVYVLVTFGQVWWTARSDGAGPADAILVLGAAQYDGRPSPVFESRLDHAADLYAAGLAPVVVVTGGSAPGDTGSEANAAFAYLRGRGVPEAAIRQEVHGLTSYESIAASARFLAEEGRRRVLLVSDGWHLRRSRAIAESVGLEAATSPAPGSPYSTGAALRQMVRETAGLAVGRIIGFRRLDRLADLSADVAGAAPGI
ncbi:YdcF family protein [Euzebya sp.]|uniref:YdcF family protein n=1 Tax=Euzebya sp. TaxID=1971409 RepID=UPI0035124376